MLFHIITHTGTAAASMGVIGAALIWLGGTTFTKNEDLQKLEVKFQKAEKSYIIDVAKIDKKQAVQSVQIKNIEKDIKEIKQNGREILRILERR